MKTLMHHLKKGLPYGWWRSDAVNAWAAALFLGAMGGFIIAAWFGLLG